MKTIIKAAASAVTAIVAVISAGCSKEPEQPQPQSKSSYPEYTIQLGERLYNPYRLETM